MSAFVAESFSHATMITGFVFLMMLVVEYLNVLSEGVWQQGLRGSRWRQYLLAGFLGATPGCLGAFAVVALYSHRVVTPGAVVAAMIATSGDEAFVMISMAPKTAVIVFAVLFVVGVLVGALTDVFLSRAPTVWSLDNHELELHQAKVCHCFPWGQIVQQWRHCTLARGVLAVALILFGSGLITGQIGPSAWNWIKTTLLLTIGVGLFIISTVPDHFLEEHLWGHVAKVHVPRVFLWTFGALIAMHLLVDQFHLQSWMRENQLIVLAIACFLGLVPESGPHLVFLTLFTKGAIPFSILLASSIVQDGHGMLPILAESRLDFFRIKAINFSAGLLLGLVGYGLGW